MLLLRASQAPALLFEIGRVREESFRLAHEGTGRSVDLDRFDEHYEHLVLWERNRGEVAGAYRLARVEPVLAAKGTGGLYTHTLFHLKRGFFRELGPAVELGRSFVHPGYQRKPHSLLMLWKGIGAYLARHRECQALFGPVSISSGYSDLSRRILASYFESGTAAKSLRAHVRARHPATCGAKLPLSASLDDVDALVRAVGCPAGARGIPVLLRQYLKLGGHVLGCSIDPAFGNCLDALVVVDLRKIDRQRLWRMLGLQLAATHASARAGWEATAISEPPASTEAYD